MSEALKEFLLIAVPALVEGAMELVNGSSLDDAIAKSIEGLETARAKQKFANFQSDP